MVNLHQRVFRNSIFQILSLAIVALGQPAFCPFLGPIAASLGFALHWFFSEGFGFDKKKVSFFWFFCVQLIQLSWMPNFEYQGLYILFVYLLLAAGLAWQFSFLQQSMRRWTDFSFSDFLAIAGLWTLFEWVRLYFFCGFAFNFLGMALSCSVPSLQTASLFGILGMSFWVVLTNLLVLKFLKDRSQKTALMCFVFALAPYLYGFCYQKYYENKADEGFYSVLLVQTGLNPSQKYSLRGKEGEFIPPLMQWERVFGFFSTPIEGLDLIVFPEATVPFGMDFYIYIEEKIQNQMVQFFGEEVSFFFPKAEGPFSRNGKVSNAYVLQTLANFFQAPVLAGLDHQDERGDFYNSAFYFTPNGACPKRYDKRVLLPLAEYSPFSSLSFLSRYYGVEDFFKSGKQAEVFYPPKISPSICYEELFPSLVREGRLKGAKLLVNLSNDAYYPCSRLNTQHFTQGLIRSVENGIPLVRSCNTGVTAAVDPLGRIIKKMQNKDGDVEKVSGCLFARVPKKDVVTLFVLCGDFPVIFLSFFFVLKFFLKRVSKVLFPWDKPLEIDLDENEQRG